MSKFKRIFLPVVIIFSFRQSLLVRNSIFQVFHLGKTFLGTYFYVGPLEIKDKSILLYSLADMHLKNDHLRSR